MMALANGIVTAFEDFLNDPAGVLSGDAANTDRRMASDDDLADPALAYLSDSALPDPGKGCIIGVIDDGIPFVHQCFTLPGHVSRMASVWMQDARFRPGVGDDLPSGAEWRGAELSALLAGAASGETRNEDAIYRLTGAVDLTRPGPPSGAFETGHGAAVAPLAAGFDPADPQARNHPVIAVCLPPRIIADSMGVLAPVPILTGMLFIIHRARRLCRFIEARRGLSTGDVRLPVVINLSLGLTAGPRDGSTLLERFMDAVSATQAADLGPVQFVLPMGNHRQSRLRARLRRGQQVGWRLPPDDTTINAIEIWGPPHDHPPKGALQVTLTLPGHAPATTAFTLPWQFSVLSDGKGMPLARAYYTPHLLPDGRWRDGIAVIATPTCPERLGEPFAPPGEWRVEIAGSHGDAIYDVTAQRDEVIRGFRRGARQSWFRDPAYRSHTEAGFPILTDAQNGGDPLVIRKGTVNSYATGSRTLRAGAIYRHTEQDTAYGALLNDGQPGDCLAPVDRSVNSDSMIVRGRGSGSFALASGTSLAAPQLARWLAVQLSGGAALEGRQAIRNQAQQQFGTQGQPPILPLAAHFRDF
ncbi:hypothetical protein GIY56_10665 [Paracoccus sp. YIM 132242]|uniref:Peptidase S8/S53 domain-containing protein n=1 Tax=Paracoccus lichenicola TaxID=2665644 RepID=A0A6L6HR99_9RHOB|nr:hypothetical protein [Paracoccus lichenicola]MTE00753.1 hypothetical protein [Paracoccus lichenicola]